MLADREDIEARIVGELRRGEGQQAVCARVKAAGPGERKLTAAERWITI
jgi:hypothetical protein